MQNVVKVTSMQEYCVALRKYVEAYQHDELAVGIYGDKKSELVKIISEGTSDEGLFFLIIADLFGSITRVLQGTNPKIPFQDWIGCEESFTKDYFIATVKTVWPDLM